MKLSQKMLGVRALASIRLKRRVIKVRTFLQNYFPAFPISRSNRFNSFPIRIHSTQNRTFFYRDSAADIGVIRQMLLNQDYSLRRLSRQSELHDRYESIQRNGGIPLILDCGSNIGASAVWFSDAFPNALIACFEPDDRNFELLSKNANGLNVELHHAAIGSSSQMVSVLDPGNGEWGYRVVVDSNGKCPMISAFDFVKSKIRNGYTPFIVKIDIEGGEADLFADSTEWANEFPLIIIELHDWLFPRDGTSQNFLRFVARYDRDFVLINENIFSIWNMR